MVVDKCFQDAKSNDRYTGAADADIRRVCEEALPTYLTTRTFAVVIAGILIVYFNLVLIAFYRELAANSSNYVFPWFSSNTTNNSSANANADQYQLDVIDPSPEYEPPLPPYKMSNDEQVTRT